MDALFIQEALIEDKLTAAPKKAKRLFFSDPFIYHASRLWIDPSYRPNTVLSNPSGLAFLAETAVINHAKRLYPTYYIKGDGEVDLAYVKGSHFHPIEIKWGSQIRSQERKQIKKYPQGEIWAQVQESHRLENLPVLPLPQALYDLV